MIDIRCPKCQRNDLQIRFRYRTRREHQDWLYDWAAYSRMKSKRRILRTTDHTRAQVYCTECKALIEVMGWEVSDNPEEGRKQALFEVLRNKVEKMYPSVIPKP